MMNSFEPFELMGPTYWQLFISFWSFSDINALWVLIGVVLLGISASVIGSFVVLRKRALMGDALAHAALPGVMIAFLLFQTNSPFVMLIGAMVSSFIGMFLVDWLPKNTKIKPDAAMAITLSFSFALGVMLLSYIQGLEIAGKSGLDHILFGQAAAMLPKDLYLLSIIAISILITVAVFFDKFRLITFNRLYAQAIGLNVAFYERILAILIVTAVVIGLQIVGVVLMVAVLLTPIVAARFWSSNLSSMLFIAGFIGALGGAVSANISYMAPAMPTGPWMVVVLSMLFLISFLFAPEKGLLSNLVKQHKLRLQVREENILRTLYVLNERIPQKNQNIPISLDHTFSIEDIIKSRSLKTNELNKTLKRLVNKNFILDKDSLEIGIKLSKQGIDEAISLTRRHRLWESYLTKKVNLDPKDVHDKAEKIEHLLTTAQTQQLEEELVNENTQDPHGKLIPNSTVSIKDKGINNGK